MKIILDQDLYKWLLGLDVLKMSAISRHLSDGTILLDPSLESFFSTGLLFSRLIARLVKSLSKSGNMGHINLAALETIKVNAGPASVTHNWNLITDVLKQLGIKVDKEIKNLIINGDFDMIQDLLKQIYDFYHPKNGPKGKNDSMISKGGSPSGGSSLETSPLKMTQKSSLSPSKTQKFETDAIDIDRVRADKDLDSTSSVLEFFLVSLAKNLALEPKQTISLLANNFKYLAHILAKGAKGLFEPVAYWYLEISTHVEHLVTLILKDRENNLTLVQQACRPGLLSKSPEIVECACEFFSKLAYELTNRELMPLAWDWFVSDHGGMQACLWGLKRHPHLVESVIAVLIQYSRLELLDLLTIHLKNVCFDVKEQIATMSILFKPLSESSATKDEILNSGVVEAWAETAGRFLENDVLIDVETRQAALKLMSDIWITHPTKVEQQDYLTASVLNGLKKAARDRSKPVVMETICIMFRLLEHFAAEKSNYAAVIYKTLTFSLIENYHSTTIKEFLIRNFKALFEQNQTVPIAILLDPLLKHMQASEATASTMNMFELEFFYSLMRHPKFNETNALQLFYVMADTYLNNLAFSKDSLMILLELLNNYLNSEPLQEAIIKFIKASLAMFYSSEKNKRPKPKASYYHQSLSPVRSPSNAENDADTLKAQKRAMIIQILRAIIGLRNPNINDRAKAFILYTHIQLKTQLNSEHRGILSLLSLYGDPNELVSQFEREMKSPTKNPDLSMSMSPEQPSPTKESRMEDSMISQGDNPYSLNLLKNTAMSPKMKTLQSPKMTNSDSHKKLPKPDPKIEGMLGTVQKEFTQKQVQQIVEVDANKEKLDRQKKAMKIQLEKRKIELGVASRNQKDAEVNIVFEEGSRELEKMLEKKHGLSEIELVNLEDEEERDREAVQIFLKKYYKVLHYLFVSYANVGFQIQDHDSFTKLADRLSVMNLTDIWKLLSEHDCTKYTQQEEVYSLVRLINTRIFNRSEIKNLTFQGFKEFFVQLAVLIFSRPPKDLSYMPIFVSVETLLQTFKEATKKKGKTTLLYDDPYSTEVGEKDLHAFLNDALKKDPEYPLPEAYKKVVEQNIEFKYELPESLKIPDKYLMCYQLVEDLLIKAVGVRLVEPMVSFTSVAKAKLKVFDPTKIEYSPDHHLKATHSQKKVVKAETTNTPTKRKVLQIENKIKMSIEMKKEVAGFPYKDRATAQEVAEVLEGMLQMVTEGKASPEGKKESALKIKQKEMKEKEKEELLKLEAVAEKKRQKRAEEVKVKHQELKTKKEETDKIKAGMESPLKKKEEQRAKYVNELKEKAKDIKEKKEEEKKKKQEEEEQKKKAEEEEKKNKFKTFHTQKMEDLTKKLQENKGKKEEEEKKKAEKEEEEKKKKVNRDKQIKEIAEMNKEIKEKNKETTTRIKGMIKESEMKKVFDKYNKQLKTLFKFYVDSQHLSLAVGHTLDTLGFQSFATFAADFNIFPGIIPLRELRLLYNTLTVGKKPEPDVPLGITYDEFLESLLRISIKAREKLDRIYGINKQLEESHEKEAVKAAEEELKRQREDKGEGHNEEEAGSPVDKNVEQADTYEEIEGTTKNTLEGLLYYLDLPKDRASVLKMLVVKKESRPKNWREKVNYWKKDLVVDNLQDMLVGKMPGLGGLGLGGLGGSPTANEGPTE